MENLDNNIKRVNVCSANKFYLFGGIIFIALIICLEIVSISQFFTDNKLINSISIAVLLQIPALLCILGSTMLIDYIHRQNFFIYCCELNDNTNISYIKNKYNVKLISTNYIIFVDNKDSHNFNVWNLFYSYESADELNQKVFKV